MIFFVVFGRIKISNEFKPVFVIPDCLKNEKIEDKIKVSIEMLTEINIGGFYNKFITKKFEIDEKEFKL